MNTQTHFFLGANSGQGFKNLFGKFCKPEDHHDLIILKGGPGCGKSTMMKKIGQAMEECGEQVEYLHCSGDPDSLDGVRIPRIRAAVVDGTSPHVIEPRYPAAADRYINLGEYYDIEAAKTNREDVVRYTDTCSAAYRQAYGALGAARKLDDGLAAMMREGADQQKLLRRTEGIIGREIRGKGNGSGEAVRFLGSITHKGPVWRFDSVENLCPKIYQLQDSWGLAGPMLERIRAAARSRNYRAVVCPDPEHLTMIQHLLLPELGLAFVTSREGMEYSGAAYRRVRLDAMVSPAHCKRHKARMRFTRRMVQSLRQEGIEALREAKSAHDQLEEVYRPYVDFSGVDILTARELRRLEGYL